MKVEQKILSRPSLWSQLTRKKPIWKSLAEREQGGDDRPPKKLGLLDLIAYGVSGTLGSGIFSLSGTVAHATAGPSAVISFLIAGISCIFSAFSYAEFAARLPMAGSAFSYAYTSLGEFTAFVIGWSLVLEYGISSAVIVRSWCSYVQALAVNFSAELPEWLVALPLGSYKASVLSFLVIAFFSVIVSVGVKEGAMFNNFLTVLNVGIILCTACYGATFVDTSNWVPFSPFGMSGTVKGAGILFFSYIGFDAVSALAEETVNPQRDLPRGILGSLLTCIVFYVAVCLVLTGMLNYQDMISNYPLAEAFSFHGATAASNAVAFGAVISLSGATFCALLGQPRILYRMSSDGLLPAAFGKIHAKFGTALWSIFATCIVAGLVAFIFDLDQIANMTSIGTLLAFTIVCTSVILLRYHQPGDVNGKTPRNLGLFMTCALIAAISYNYDAPFWVPVLFLGFSVVPCVMLYRQPSVSIPKTFVCPWVPFVPCCGIVVNLFMMWSLDWESWLRLFIWFAIGLLIYFGYGLSHSKLRDFEYLEPEEGGALLNSGPSVAVYTREG